MALSKIYEGPMGNYRMRGPTVDYGVVKRRNRFARESHNIMILLVFLYE